MIDSVVVVAQMRIQVVDDGMQGMDWALSLSLDLVLLLRRLLLLLVQGQRRTRRRSWEAGCHCQTPNLDQT